MRRIWKPIEKQNVFFLLVNVLVDGSTFEVASFFARRNGYGTAFTILQINSRLGWVLHLRSRELAHGTAFTIICNY
jgi:hypothetical protein